MVPTGRRSSPWGHLDTDYVPMCTDCATRVLDGPVNCSKEDTGIAGSVGDDGDGVP